MVTPPPKGRGRRTRANAVPRGPARAPAPVRTARASGDETLRPGAAAGGLSGEHVPNADLSSVEGVLAMVRARGGRATPSRRVLLEVLFETDEHLNAEELAQAVQARAPDVHISTIYRNLEDLQALGVVVHSHLGHGPATYQLTAAAHAHLLCERCGSTVEAPEEFFRGLAAMAWDRFGFSIDPRHFAIQGRCSACTATLSSAAEV